MSLPNTFTNEFSSVSVAKLDQNFTYLETYTTNVQTYATNLSTGVLTRSGWLIQNHSNYILPLSTPQGTVPTKVTYGNGTTSTLIVPATVTSILVKMWGAGGGGGSYGGWRQGSLGGAGGYSHAIIPVVPGETITIRPGAGGGPQPGAAKAFPDGGGASLSGGDNQYTASAGGSSSIRVPSISSAFCLWAGGGGGGGSVNGYAVNSGGAGGGLTGSAGSRTSYSAPGGPNNADGVSHMGGGGSQTAGGAAGAGANTTGQAGSQYQGGTHQNANCYGGGGGGGFYGGGSGAYGNNSSMGGGGGGSGYVHPQLIMGVTQSGNGRVPGNASDPDLSMSSSQTIQFALGGEEAGYGGLGLVVIYY
jgi:hypothetical protein